MTVEELKTIGQALERGAQSIPSTELRVQCYEAAKAIGRLILEIQWNLGFKDQFEKGSNLK